MSNIANNYWNSEQLDPEIDGVAPMGECGKVEIYYRNYLESKHFKRILKTKDKVLLEIGCGAGRWALNLHKNLSHYDGVDISQPSIDFAQQLATQKGIHNCSFYCCDVQDFTPNVKYDIIYFGGVTQYIEANELTLLIYHIKKWLKPNGIIIDRSTITLENQTKVINRSGYFSIYRTADELKHLFKQEGFKQVYQKKSYRFLRIGKLKRLLNHPKLISFIRVTSPFSFNMMFLYTYIQDILKPKVYKEDICGRFSHEFMIFSFDE